MPDSLFHKRMDFEWSLGFEGIYQEIPCGTFFHWGNGWGRTLRLHFCPRVLFLDEPTIGLNVSVKDNIRRAITQINQKEETSHSLDHSRPERHWATLWSNFYDWWGQRFWWNGCSSKETLARWRLFPLNCYQGKSHLVSHYEELFGYIDRQGNSLNIGRQFRYQSADIIKQTLSDLKSAIWRWWIRILRILSVASMGALRWSELWRRYKPFYQYRDSGVD